jgi:hypothetical protein
LRWSEKKWIFYGHFGLQFGGSFRNVSGYHGEIDSQAVTKQRGHVTNVKLYQSFKITPSVRGKSEVMSAAAEVAIQWLCLLVINLTTLNRTKLVDAAISAGSGSTSGRVEKQTGRSMSKALITRRN